MNPLRRTLAVALSWLCSFSLLPAQQASIESVKRDLKSEFEQDDLDVPAFLRKRNESR